jgi:hypothetical protein
MPSMFPGMWMSVMSKLRACGGFLNQRGRLVAGLSLTYFEPLRIQFIRKHFTNEVLVFDKENAHTFVP